MDHDALMAKYLGGERLDITNVMRGLPGTANVELAVRVIAKLTEHSVFWFGRSCKELPPRIIRGVLAAELPGPVHLFVRLAVSAEASDAAMASAWQRALTALLDLDTTYAWGSKQRRAKIAGLAADPHLLQAIQATVAHAPVARLDMLAVLVADGSDASYDALVGHIGAAFSARDARLDLLSRLRTHATRTPALDALFAELDGALQARNDSSPALALGPLIGIGEVPLLWFDVRLGSRRVTSSRVPWLQGSIEIDSRSASWFRAWVSGFDPDRGRRATSFGTDGELHDDLGLGRCVPEDLPRWLANTAAKLEIEWQAFEPRSNLRGAKRGRIAAWLAGVPPPATTKRRKQSR